MDVAIACMVFVWFIGATFTAGWLYDSAKSLKVYSNFEFLLVLLVTLALCMILWPMLLGSELRRKI